MARQSRRERQEQDILETGRPEAAPEKSAKPVPTTTASPWDPLTLQDIYDSMLFDKTRQP